MSRRHADRHPNHGDDPSYSLDELTSRGHRFQKIGRKGEVRYGYASAAVVDVANKRVEGGAEPRRSHAAVAFRLPRPLKVAYRPSGETVGLGVNGSAGGTPSAACHRAPTALVANARTPVFPTETGVAVL